MGISDDQTLHAGYGSSSCRVQGSGYRAQGSGTVEPCALCPVLWSPIRSG
jgi:hypothetical protein